MIDNLKRHFNILNKVRLSVVFKVTIILILNFKSGTVNLLVIRFF